MSGHGITNSQAKYLAALCRCAKERYPGNGMSSYKASREIERLLAQLRATGDWPESETIEAER